MPTQDILSLTGSVNLQGTLTASGSVNLQGSLTGSLLGTASYWSGSIKHAESASFANRSLAADRIKTINVGGAGTYYPLMGSSFFGDVTTHTIETPTFRYDSAISQLAVFSISSSFTGSLRGTAATASYWSGSIKHAESASFATSASWAPTPTTASYAVTASYAPPAPAAYKIYRATVTYNFGTFSITQLENTIGDGSGNLTLDIEWSNPYNAVLHATMINGFTAPSDKIFIRPSAFGGGTALYTVTGNKQTDNVLEFVITKYDGDTSSTPYFTDLPIEILIYN